MTELDITFCYKKRRSLFLFWNEQFKISRIYISLLEDMIDEAIKASVPCISCLWMLDAPKRGVAFGLCAGRAVRGIAGDEASRKSAEKCKFCSEL